MFTQGDHRRTDSGGFTLVELLIVILVLALVSAIVVFAIGHSAADARTAECQTAITSIALAAEAVKTETGEYPTAPAQLIEPAARGMLAAWPGGTDPAHDDFVYAYAPDSSAGFTITISGQAVPGARTVNGDLLTKVAVTNACTSS